MHSQDSIDNKRSTEDTTVQTPFLERNCLFPRHWAAFWITSTILLLLSVLRKVQKRTEKESKKNGKRTQLSNSAGGLSDSEPSFFTPKTFLYGTKERKCLISDWVIGITICMFFSLQIHNYYEFEDKFI